MAKLKKSATPTTPLQTAKTAVKKTQGGDNQATLHAGVVRALPAVAGRPKPVKAATQPPARSGGPRRRHRADDGDLFAPNSLLAELT